MDDVEEYIVPKNTVTARITDHLVGKFDRLPSRAGIKKAIKKGEILLNGEPVEPSRFIHPGDRISLIMWEKPLPRIFELPLQILFEDDWLAVLLKPAGIAVSGNRYRTIQQALPFNLQPSGRRDALSVARPVHRLDIPTRGLLLIAKTAGARAQLGRQFEGREVRKHYRAIVAGKLDGEGEIVSPVGELAAITKYHVVENVPSLKTGWLSLLDLYPETGRKHQLRIHLAELGHPIVGDRTYTGESPLLRGKGLFLSAVGLQFMHPETGREMEFRVAQPEKFDALLEREAKRWKKYHGEVS
jgi:23S rRNA pseudouridine1911/1915/1917 synthase